MDKKAFFRLIYGCFLIPVVIMLLSAMLIYGNYKSSLEKELKSNYISNLAALSDSINNSLEEIQNTSFLLTTDDNFYDIFYSAGHFYSEDVYKIREVSDNLVKFKSTNDLIDSVYVLHKGSNMVIDTLGSYDADRFFSRVAKYDAYPASFWFNFSTNRFFYQMLAPSQLEDTSNDAISKRAVIPFVTASIGSSKSPNLLVVNISVNALNNMISKYKFMDSSQIAVISNNGTVFSSSDDGLSDLIASDPDFLQSVVKSQNSFFEYASTSGKHLVVALHPKPMQFNDFTYIAFIPYNDFYKKLADTRLLAYLFIIFGILGSLIISYFMSIKIYSPISNLISIIAQNEPDNSRAATNEIDYLNNQITKILSDNSFLKQDLSLVLPFVHEQYLIKILTNDDFLLDDDVRDFINNNNLAFKYPYFCVAVIELNFTDKFYASYNEEEYLAVRRGIAKLVEDIGLRDYPSYVLNIAKNRIAVIINLENANDNADMLSKVKSTIALFSYDYDLLNIKVGVGRVFSDYIGINQSYKEAISALAAISSANDDNVRIYSEATNACSYQYPIRDENKLYNYILSGHKDEALSFFNLLIEKNLQNNPTLNAMKQFYLSVYNTVLRILENKGISAMDLMGPNYIDLINEFDRLTASEMKRYINLLISNASALPTSGGKIDINKVLEYIDANYKADIYLTQVAEAFNTSDKYLSRLFKEKLGIGFHEYLTVLRIEKAKSLLSDTELSVNQIGEMVGFTNYSTFFRLFKKYEGVNPSQYRDNIKAV